MTVKIRALEKSDRGRLENYLLRSPNSSLYHHVDWQQVIEKSFGHRFDYLIAEVDGAVQGALPVVHIDSLIFGNYMVSLPYFNYGGPCAESEQAREKLVEEAVSLGRRRKVRFIEFRSTEKWNNGFPAKTGKVAMVLALQRSPEKIWRGFPSKLRSQIRRPEQDGMEARIGRLDELDGFYSVFSINMRDLGTPVYPRKFFENILRVFPGNTWICTVYKGTEAVASGFLAGYKNRMEIPWASTVRKYNRMSPNMLLYWTSIRFACDSGYEIFDFGRSTPGEGTYRFKEQWGAKPVQLYWHYWLREGEAMPELNPKNRKFGVAIEIWKRLPVPVANILGPGIVKNLP